MFLMRLWISAGNHCQIIWESVHSFFHSDSATNFFFDPWPWATLILLNGLFWAVNLIFFLIDVTGRPSFLKRYKIQDPTHAAVSFQTFLAVSTRVFANQVFVGTPFMFFCYYLMLERGCSFGPELPALTTVLLQMLAMSLVEEVGFYYAHRALHLPFFYKHIHKTHHEWKTPISIVSLYSHPLEHLFSALLPVMAGPIIVGAHVSVLWLWLAIATCSTTISHCGYHLPFFPSPEAHDFHHLKFTDNFGTLGILDRLHGTDRRFRQTKAYERHFLLLSLVPMKRLIPDDLESFPKHPVMAA